MKILQVITELTPAGAERIVCELSKELSEKGNYITVISLMPFPENDSVLCELRNAGIDVLSLNLTKFTLWRIFKLRRIIKELKPDIVHSHLIHSNLITRLAKIANSAKFKLINTVHIAERRPGKWWHFALDRLTYSLCDCQTAVSKAVRDFHAKMIRQPAKDIPVIYNGVQAPKLLNQQKIEKLRNEWGMENCSKIIGSVGRLDWQKGYDNLLKMLPEISSNIPKGEKWGLVILGEGKQRRELESIANSAKLENIEIILPGFRNDAADSIGAFDLFVMPSRYEGFGLTLIEAMGHGIPILASNADSLPELMDYYGNGECIDFNNKDQVLKTIPAYINKTPETHENSFSTNKMVAEYLQIYNTSPSKKTQTNPNYLQKGNKILFGLLLILLFISSLFLLYNIDKMGFRFCDEGYHLLHPIALSKNPDYPNLYFKHGLMVWIYAGLTLLGFTITSALVFSVICGLFSTLFLFLLCLRISSGKTALLASTIYSFTYYIFYYHRSNMSDGYALMFFNLILLLFITSMQYFGILPYSDNEYRTNKNRKSTFIIFVLGGLIFGFSFTVRIQTCMTMIGVIGALGITLLIGNYKKEVPFRNIFRYTIIAIIWILLGLIGYSIFMYSINDWIKWDRTIEWYFKNITITETLRTDWQPFVLIYTWKLCSLPFIITAIIGVMGDLKNCLKLNIYRRWLLICFLGLLAAYLKMSMPWPRAYLYFIFILVFYWVIGCSYIINVSYFKNNIKIKKIATAALLIITIIGELFLIIPFINKQSGYNDAIDFIEKNGKGSLRGTHTWPNFATLSFPHKNYIIYDMYKCFPAYPDFAVSLKAEYEEKNVKYIILDNYITYLGGNNKMLQQFVVTNLPDAVFINDFGNDFHTHVDSFTIKQKNSIFNDKIMIYDMKNLERIPRTPIPYFNNIKMNEIFSERWKLKTSKHKKNSNKK